jgi:hypothetical protein
VAKRISRGWMSIGRSTRQVISHIWLGCLRRYDYGSMGGEDGRLLEYPTYVAVSAASNSGSHVPLDSVRLPGDSYDKALLYR